MKVTVINYNSGNVLSVLNALRRIGVEAQLSDDIECIRNSDRIIFPGQGEARQTMDFMRKHSLDQAIKELTQPYLGICIGMQILAERSEEKDPNEIDFETELKEEDIPKDNLVNKFVNWFRIRKH